MTLDRDSEFDWPWDDPWYIAEMLRGDWNLSPENRRWHAWDKDLPVEEGDPKNWLVWHFDYHDPSGSLTNKVNVDVIWKRLRRFLKAGKNVVSVQHGIAVRMFKLLPTKTISRDQITPAFEAVCELRWKLRQEGVLDEDRWLTLQHDETMENLWDVLKGHDLYDFIHWAPQTKNGHTADRDTLVQAVWDWMWQNDQESLEADDDGGAYPSEEAMAKAIIGLGWTTYLRVHVERSDWWDHPAVHLPSDDIRKSLLAVEAWLTQYNPNAAQAMLKDYQTDKTDERYWDVIRQAFGYLGWLEEAEMTNDERRYQERLRHEAAMKRDGAKQLSLFRLSGDKKWLGPGTQLLAQFISGEEIKGKDAGPF